MPPLRRYFWLLVLVASASSPALAWPKPSCKDKCGEKVKECSKICVEHAAPKVVGYCKKACSDEGKRCDDKCGKKSR